MYVTNEFFSCGRNTGEDSKIALQVENDLSYGDCVLLRVLRYREDGNPPDELSSVSVKGDELKRAVENCLRETAEVKTDG